MRAWRQVCRLAALSSLFHATVWAGKSQDVNQALGIVSKINALAINTRVIDELTVRRIVEHRLSEVHSPEVLVKIAVLCKSVAHPQRAEDARYDAYFDAVYWKCLLRLSRIPGDAAAEGFDEIEQLTIMRGGDLVGFQELREQQRRLTASRTKANSKTGTAQEPSKR